MKKEEPDVRAAKSLHREYLFFVKNASRPGAPKLEADYYNRLAASTSTKIDWELLKSKKKKVEREENDEYYYDR